MIAIQVMRQENKYILKIIDRLCEIAKETHHTKQLCIEQAMVCLEFFKEYIVSYQQVKQEMILFKCVREYTGEEIESFIERLRVGHIQANKYLNEMDEACKWYSQGRYLAIYDFINSAMSYQKLAKQCIEEEEKIYTYSERMLPTEYQQRIDNSIAIFHRQAEREQDIFNLTTF